MTTRHTWTTSILQVTITRHADGSLTLVNNSKGRRCVEVDGERYEMEAIGPVHSLELQRVLS